MSIAARRLSLGSRLAIALIAAYQQYLSPRKGFRCAHRVLHSGDSCSEHAKGLITEEGFVAGIRGIRRRFNECRAAARILAHQHENQASSTPVQTEDGSASTTANGSDTTRQKTTTCIDGDACSCLAFTPADAAADTCIACSGRAVIGSSADCCSPRPCA